MIDFVRTVSRSLRTRRTNRELSGLPDHILKDIGVSRSEIPHIALTHSRGGE